MELLNVIYSLNQNPKRGSTVKELKHLGMGHLFIIYPITKRNKIKVIYFIEDSTQTIHITDFFPCQMNPSSITRRR